MSAVTPLAPEPQPVRPLDENMVEFTLRLGQALHRYGTPAHRLEEVMSTVSEQLGINSRFMSTPTGIFASFGAPEQLKSTLIRVDPGEMNLDRLCRLDQVTADVVSRRITPAQGADAIEAILAEPPHYGPKVTVACFALAAASAAPLFGGGFAEAAVAGLIGIPIGLLGVGAERRPGIARIFEPLAAFLASALSVAGSRLVGYSTEVATLSALVFLLPGLALTVAMTELATRNLISGTSRFTGAALVFLQLGFGVALGRKVDLLLPPAPAPAPLASFPPWAMIPSLAIITLALAVLFKARLRDAGYILLSGALAYAGGRLGAHFLGPELGAFLGAMVLGIGTNLFASLTRRTGLLMLVPGIMLLVPGALGYRSLESLMGQDVVAGVGTAVSGLVVAVALVAGTLLANAVVPPRRAL